MKREARSSTISPSPPSAYSQAPPLTCVQTRRPRFTDTLREELGQGIRVIALLPGATVPPSGTRSGPRLPAQMMSPNP